MADNQVTPAPIHHNFATSCIKCLADLIKVRDRLQRLQDAANGLAPSDEDIPEGYWRDSMGELWPITRIFAHRDIGNIGGSGSASDLATVDFSGPKSIGKKRQSSQLRALLIRLAQAKGRCAEQWAASGEITGGGEDENGDLIPASNSHAGQVGPCPKADAIQQQINTLIYGKKTIGRGPTGGGGGGGY